MDTAEQKSIDAVIMWVDGSDPAHFAKLNAYLVAKGLRRKGAASKTRFHHAGELDYCVASLLKFAPWLRTIYIVTDNQRPELLDKVAGTRFASKIKLIDHGLIFSGYEDYLPSFNSMAISSLLWRIPGISENFLYFNDDFMLIRPVYPEDFFRHDKVILRGKWHRLPETFIGFNLYKTLKNGLRSDVQSSRVSFWDLQKSCARLLGFTRSYFRLPHVPHAWKKSSWEAIFSQFPDAVLSNISAQLRSAKQYVPESLSAHFHCREALSLIDNRRTNLQLKPTDQLFLRIWWKLRNANRNPEVVFCCVQSIEMTTAKKQKLIRDWLDQRIGHIDDLIKADID